MKSILFLLLLLASAATVSADKQEPAWSPAVNGLRARLAVLPPGRDDCPFCRVMLEMENVDDVAGQKKIRFTPDKLKLKVTNQAGESLPIANGVYDATTPLWEPTLLPYRGVIKFQVSFPGMGYHPDKHKVIVDMGFLQTWVIPQDGLAYHLSGNLVVSREKRDHPTIDWNGTLELPKVLIPPAE